MRLQLYRRSKLDILLLLTLLIAGYVVLHQAVAIGDWLHQLVYQPPGAVVQLAEAAGMNNEGKKLFYRYSPQLVSPSVLQHECGSYKLGCTAGRHIWILVSRDGAQQQRNIVTAAHEMLHIAYGRLSKADKQAVDADLKQELDSNNSRVSLEIQAELKTYPSADFFNEAHSLVGSELWPAGPALDGYFAHYFADRAKVTRAFLASPEGQLAK